MHNEDIKIAKNVMDKACCKYSNFQVGAALKTKSGKIYSGCNIENHGIQSICAERVAFVKALSEGENEFESITIVCSKVGKKIKGCLPCGYCREFISEYVDEDFRICTIDDDNNIKQYTLKELLPFNFEI